MTSDTHVTLHTRRLSEDLNAAKGGYKHKNAAERLQCQPQYNMHIISEYANKGLSAWCNEPCAEHRHATGTRICRTLEELTFSGFLQVPYSTTVTTHPC